MNAKYSNGVKQEIVCFNTKVEVQNCIQWVYMYGNFYMYSPWILRIISNFLLGPTSVLLETNVTDMYMSPVVSCRYLETFQSVNMLVCRLCLDEPGVNMF